MVSSTMRSLRNLLCVIVLVYCCGKSEGGYEKKTVHITNDMVLNEALTVHCKSGEDDLGAHVLQKGQSYSFSFRNSFFKMTLFFCNFQWKSEKGVVVSKWYDIYDAEEPTGDCTQCFWTIYEDVVCLWVEETRKSRCFSYNTRKSYESLRA